MSLVKSIAFAGLASMASAHILLTNPVPFTPIGVTNAPLAADGSDFPCRTGGSYTGVQANVYEAGSTQKLQFKGTAVHGGGSCQVSVTSDLNPTKDSVWKVIKSIEGGCPAQDQAGNLPGDSAELPVPYAYDFTVPDLAAGTYTLAWTWFNKIGNREMYMNCAPLEVTGGSGSTDLNSLPDMLVANINNGCFTSEGTDIQFPNPGGDVVQMNGATQAFGAPGGTCTGSPGSAQPPAQTQPEPTQAPVVENPVDVPPPAAENPVEPPPVAVPAPTDGGSGLSGACSTEGNWNCVSGSAYQRCASGQWSALQPVAAGTTCVGGESADLTLA